MLYKLFQSIFGQSTHSQHPYCQRLRNDGSAIFDYSFLMALSPKEYPRYLKEAYSIKLGQQLNLKRPKTFNEKIQWLKIYDNKPIKSQLTDKILVRDWIKDRISSEYLKPVLQICNNYDEIDFDKLAESFIVKCNHGCRWQFIVKKKEEYLDNKSLCNVSKQTVNGWLEQSFFGWSDFETQYKNIIPKIIIEPLLREDMKYTQPGIQVYCFNSEPKIFYKYKRGKDCNEETLYTTFDENYKQIDLKFDPKSKQVEDEADILLKKAVELSKVLAKGFKLVRVDWMIYNNKLYFEEMTFTPYSGFFQFNDKYTDWDKELGKMLNLKGM